MADEPNLGDVAPRKKKSSFTTYLIIGVIAVLVIGGVSLFTGGDDNGEPANGNTNPSTPITIPQLKSSVDSLTTRLDSPNGVISRLALLEKQMGIVVAPTVTQADIDSLQVSINDLSTKIDAFEGNSSTFNVSGGSTHWLTEDSDDDIWLHILSAKDMRFVAEVTVSYDDPFIFGNTTYDMALSDFYNDVGIDRDYLPNLIPYNTYPYTTETCYDYNLTILQGGVNTTFLIPVCYNTTTILSDWEYSTITFHTGSFNVDANEDFSGRIDYLPEDYDTISVRLLPSLETSESDGGGGI